ncbi:MAG TPA: nucleoside kinase [Bacilli bacterium]|nr:nucleoside kinase [Bacilli bacterium]
MNNNMITIKLKNETRLVPKGSTLLSLLPDEQKKKFFVALVNGRVRELSFKISFDAEVEFLDLTHSEAGKAYEASLRYVIAMIFNELYPEESIRFSYNVSRSIFCQPLGNFHIERRIVDQVANRLREIVDADIPIERVTVSTEEAIQIYQKFNLHDKIDILKYRPEKDVHLYRCGNYFNCLHSYMVPSTGYLQNFILRPYSPGIIIQYPRYELNGQIPPFEEAPTYGRTLKRAYEWAKLIDTQTIYRINEKLTPENTVDFIQICETKHNNMLSEIGNLIKADIDNIRLIAIAGPSSSGKTTFSNRLRLQLMALGINPVMISIDDYYLDRDKIQPDENGEIDLEDIKTIDVELFNQHMYSLINGEEVELPRFDFMTAKRVPGRKIKVDPHSPIIIEGIHALNEQLSASIPKHQKFKIFISPQIQISIDNHSPMSTTDLRLIRRLVRDFKFRNAPAKRTLSMWPSVRRGEFKWIYPHQEQADYVFNSELTYELGVLKKYALPILKEIGPTDEDFIVANRLIKYLKYFRSIDDDAVPCNSLLREFIGGSCFNV